MYPVRLKHAALGGESPESASIVCNSSAIPLTTLQRSANAAGFDGVVSGSAFQARSSVRSSSSSATAVCVCSPSTHR